jgi:hypothetical protein
MKFIDLRYISFIVIFNLFIPNLHAQDGLQISVSGLGGIGLVSPQNHYDNPFYELDYKYKLGYGAQVNVGYGLSSNIAIVFTSGYQTYHQQYKGNFSPGYGSPDQSHLKDINLDYINLGLMAKYTTSFKDDYVFDTKAQLVVMGGLIASKLINADVSYLANGEEISYPSKIPPYNFPGVEYPYTPITNDKELFTKWALSFVLNIGTDIFITPKLALSPSIQGQIAILDINNKNYRNHENYKSSRLLFGGLNLGLTYYFSRAEN